MRILSLGAGVQSSTLALMIEHGEIEPVDAAIFADTGWEPKAVYDWLDWLESRLSYPVYRVSKGNIRNDVVADEKPEARFMIPSFTIKGIGKRQCTRHYKLAPIMRKVRQLGATYKNPATMLIGISLDEVQRVKPSRVKYIVNTHPLVERRINRLDCIRWMQAHGYPMPAKSSCIGCPFHSNDQWRALTHEEFENACEFDDFIRENGHTLGVKQYLHRDLRPLRDVDLSEDQTIEMFNNECEGMCGV